MYSLFDMIEEQRVIRAYHVAEYGEGGFSSWRRECSPLVADSLDTLAARTAEQIVGSDIPRLDFNTVLCLVLNFKPARTKTQVLSREKQIDFINRFATQAYTTVTALAFLANKKILLEPDDLALSESDVAGISALDDKWVVLPQTQVDVRYNVFKIEDMNNPYFARSDVPDRRFAGAPDDTTERFSSTPPSLGTALAEHQYGHVALAPPPWGAHMGLVLDFKPPCEKTTALSREEQLLLVKAAADEFYDVGGCGPSKYRRNIQLHKDGLQITDEDLASVRRRHPSYEFRVIETRAAD